MLGSITLLPGDGFKPLRGVSAQHRGMETANRARVPRRRRIIGPAVTVADKGREFVGAEHCPVSAWRACGRPEVGDNPGDPVEIITHPQGAKLAPDAPLLTQTEASPLGEESPPRAGSQAKEAGINGSRDMCF